MNVQAIDIINTMFNPEDTVCFRVFDDRKGGTFTGMKLSCDAGQYAVFENNLVEHNKLNRGVFYVVNSGGQTDDEISRINAQFVEMDEGTFDEQQAKIDAFPLPPSIIIKTRKSLHVYWLIRNGSVDIFRSIQKGLVSVFAGDPACVNESRVMRLPGFYHCKKEPVMVECISFHPERRYTQEELMEHLPEAEDDDFEVLERRQGSEAGLDIVLRSCDFIRHCREDAANLSEHDWYAMISNLAVFSGGVDAIMELSKNYPGFNANATQKKINHFLESGTGPMTCRTIAEKGYQCPKLADGSCRCKAPAAVSFVPLSADGLQNIILGLPRTDNVVENMQTAQRFVRGYLYNQDPVTAETIISSTLKEHFKLTGTYIKPLSKEYKELAKQYAAKTKIKENREEGGIPEWYEPTPAGLKFMPGVLADCMAQSENVIFAAEEFYRYEAGVYSQMSDLGAKGMVREKMLSREARNSQITDAKEQWKVVIQQDMRTLNANPYIINLKNGLYNVLEGKKSEHDPAYYTTVQLNVSFDPKADCPRFKAFLEDVMEGDMDQVKLIQEILGYFLIPVNSAQKCFVIVGEASAGKSVLLKVLNEVLLGRENVSNVSWQALNERFKTAELFGKLANIFADLPTKNIDDNGIFKALVGEDYLTVEKKNKNPFSFLCTARMLFSCNSIPINYGDRSEGFYRRLIIIRFNKTVPPEKRDPGLLDKFRAEGDGILMFALQGLERLIAQNFHFSETEKNLIELEQYREDSDSVLSFVSEWCVLEESAEIGSTDLYNAYKQYCEECGVKPFSQRKMVQQIIQKYQSVNRSVDKLGKRRTLCGMRLGDILE